MGQINEDAMHLALELFYLNRDGRRAAGEVFS